jgi:resuscitation-promoting factor RpfA
MATRPVSITGRSLARLAVVGAVTAGSAAALMGTANAAPDSAWDKLAQCESGGNWNINTGNGYYGGLQFNLGTWRAFGGSGMPNQASKAQQIAVAERILAAQGWNAWPSCSRKMGLRGIAAEPTKVRAAAPAPAAPAPAAKPAPAPVAKNGADYTVVAGDTLSGIAARENVPGGWQAIYQRNADVLSNPNVLRVGQQLDLR